MVVVTPVPSHHLLPGLGDSSDMRGVGLSPLAQEEVAHHSPATPVGSRCQTGSAGPDRTDPSLPRAGRSFSEESHPGTASHQLASLQEETQAMTGTPSCPQTNRHTTPHALKSLPSSPSPLHPFHPPPLPPAGPSALHAGAAVVLLLPATPPVLLVLPPPILLVLPPSQLPFPVLF